jgi:tRNA-2-methylthio-N6-dimethylallyladenosine synthase
LTAASRLKDDVPPEVKKKRLIELQSLQRNMQLDFHRGFLDRVERVLCLGKSKKNAAEFSGRNEGNQVINFRSKYGRVGHFLNVRITSWGPYSLRGEAVEASRPP